ncbi:MAG: ligase-associated DNA damage response DEXH box helicase [Croceimicrobium sp.]
MAELYPQAHAWFAQSGWEAAAFQEAAWRAYAEGKCGIVNAPTGSGKTYSLLIPSLLRSNSKKGLQCIWITPIRALAKEIRQSAERAAEGMGLDISVGARTGDTSSAERAKQKRQMPNLLITTPESLHLLLASKQNDRLFKNLHSLIVDEWHELMGSKRAVQIELALSRLRGMNPQLQTWGISATIGNMEEAMDVLLGPQFPEAQKTLIRSASRKKIEVESILPDSVEVLPWAGHLGIKMLEKVIPIIEQSESTLIFTNTRSQSEIWYQRILDQAPQMAGIMAMHHGSISKELRNWVEDALYTGQLKAVVCTSSLDLGVDFRPVDTIIQVGSPKGVARFMQRAGRSGHQPGATSKIFFVPTHTLELVEAAALREAIKQEMVENRMPYLRSFDVLVQYLVSLAVGDGFHPDEILAEVRATFSYQDLRDDEWQWCLAFIRNGGQSLESYDEYHKVEVEEDGSYKVNRRRTAMRHRMSIGTIVGDGVVKIKFESGGYLGTIEEYFVSRLKPGDVFWFAGKNLELVRFKGMDAQVKLSRRKNGQVPSWQGGRMPLSAQMGQVLRQKLEEGQQQTTQDPELKLIKPLWDFQEEHSIIPNRAQLLIERIKSKEGYHLFVYPFEGRAVHEGLSALLAYRLSLMEPISASIAMNDYGFELLSDKPLAIEEAIDSDIFSTVDLREDIMHSINAIELAGRRFRDIAVISGLVYRGYPGEQVKEKHLQSHSSLIFKVLNDYEPDNLLLQQAYEEALEFQLEEGRMRMALERIAEQEIVICDLDKPSPFCFPIMVDRLRERMTNESLEDRVKKMQVDWG